MDAVGFKRGCDLLQEKEQSVTCSGCSAKVESRKVARRSGWQLDPSVCLDCMRWTLTERGIDSFGRERKPIARGFRIERHRRYWALYEGETLICLTVYRRGARSVLERLCAPRRKAQRVSRGA